MLRSVEELSHKARSRARTNLHVDVRRTQIVIRTLKLKYNTESFKSGTMLELRFSSAGDPRCMHNEKRAEAVVSVAKR